MKTEDLIKLALIAGIAYALYYVVTSLQKAPGVDQATSLIANFYSWLTLPPSMIVNGNIILPGGALVPLALTDVRQNGGGAVVAEYQGHFYMLSPSDANGDWPAMLIQ